MARNVQTPTDDPGFEPMDPWKVPELRIWRRNLPHLECAGATYFVTLTCVQGVELNKAARTSVLDALLHWSGTRIYLDAAVVMPDHAHAVFRVAQGIRLGDVLKSVKSFSSRTIGKTSGTGSMWLDENFDHIIRHEDEWIEKIEYIRQNPVKKGLAAAPEGYRWIYLSEEHRPGGRCH